MQAIFIMTSYLKASSFLAISKQLAWLFPSLLLQHQASMFHVSSMSTLMENLPSAT
jgi:hypothetical protein